MVTDDAWWWLSFVDPNLDVGHRFLGAAIVRGAGMVDAVREAWRLGVNPGGEVAGGPMRPAHVPGWAFRERLLTRAEATEALTTVGDVAVRPDGSPVE